MTETFWKLPLTTENFSVWVLATLPSPAVSHLSTGTFLKLLVLRFFCIFPGYNEILKGISRKIRAVLMWYWKKKIVGATVRKQNNFKMKSEWFFLLFKYGFFNLAFFKMQLFSPCFSFLLTYYLCLCLFIICFYP